MEFFGFLAVAFIVFLVIRAKSFPKRSPPPVRDPYVPRSTYTPPPRLYDHPRRDKVVQELKDWLAGTEMTDVIVFDTETNGLDPETASLLSVGAIRFSWSQTEVLVEKGRFTRYYFPVEPYDPRAIAVNGLSEEKLKELRGSGEYPAHFKDDDSFKEFCKGAHLVAGHNVSFDVGFVPFMRNRRKFCTMMSNADVVCASWNDRYDSWKWPTLEETARFYKVPFSPEDAHGALYDALVTSIILIKMLKAAKISVMVHEDATP